MNYYYKNKEGKVFTNTGSNPTPVKWGVKYDCYPIDRTTFNSTCGNVVAIKDGTDPNWSAAWQGLPEPKNYGKYRPSFICCFKEPTQTIDMVETSTWNDSNCGAKTGYYPTFKANQDFHCFEQVNFYYGKEDVFNNINLENCSVYEWNAPKSDLENYSTTGSTITNTISTKTLDSTLYCFSANNTVLYFNQDVPDAGVGAIGDGDYRYKIIKCEPVKHDYNLPTEIVSLERGLSAVKIKMTDLADFTKLKVSLKTTQNVSVTALSVYEETVSYINNGGNYKTTTADPPYYGLWFFSNENKLPQKDTVTGQYYVKSTLKAEKIDSTIYYTNTGMIPEELTTNNIRTFIKHDSMPCHIYTREDFENGKNLYIMDVNFAEEYNDVTHEIDFSTSDNKIPDTKYKRDWPEIKQGTYLSSYFEKYPSLKEFMKTAVLLTGYGGSNGVGSWFYNHQYISTDNSYSWSWGSNYTRDEVTEYPIYFYPTTDYSNNYVRSVATLENCHYNIDLSENDGNTALYILYPMMTTLYNPTANVYEPIYSKFQMFIEGIK